jgi:hypothetical protein
MKKSNMSFKHYALIVISNLKEFAKAVHAIKR